MKKNRSRLLSSLRTPRRQKGSHGRQAIPIPSFLYTRLPGPGESRKESRLRNGRKATGREQIEAGHGCWAPHSKRSSASEGSHGVPARSQLRGSQLRRRLVALQPRRHPQGPLIPLSPSARTPLAHQLPDWFAAPRLLAPLLSTSS